METMTIPSLSKFREYQEEAVKLARLGEYEKANVFLSLAATESVLIQRAWADGKQVASE